MLGSRRCLIYGAAIPRDIAAALEGLSELKARYNLSPNFEIKWSSKGGDPELKAVLKEEAISLIGRLFSCVFVVWASTDKDEAFLRMAELLNARASENKQQYVHLFYDHDAFRTRNKVVPVLSGWNQPSCTLFADVDSSLSSPMQYADLAIGAFSYLLRSQFGLVRPKTTLFEWEPGNTEMLRLEQVFGVLLRWTIPGTTPLLDLSASYFPPEMFMKECVGTGVIVDPRFSSEEVANISRASTFYVGCMS